MTEILTLKYRPANWDEIIGQDDVVRSFRKVLASGSNHTFLLSGSPGTGKTTMARIAAAEKGCAPVDIQEVNAANFTSVEDMRQIIQSLQYRPLGDSKARAIILDECQALSKSAWQSLLKPLEEPPKWVYWFLCTTDPSKVPANIQSRCSKYPFKLVTRPEIREWLAEIAEAEELKLGSTKDDYEAILDQCAKAAQGSPRAGLVGLGACAGAKDRKAASALLRASEEIVGSHQLAKALMGNSNWMAVYEILDGLKGEPPESVRLVVLNYMSKVIMGGKCKEKDVVKYMAILEAFSKPFYQSEGMAPLLLACGTLLFSE